MPSPFQPTEHLKDIEATVLDVERARSELPANVWYLIRCIPALLHEIHFLRAKLDSLSPAGENRDP